MRNCRQRVLVFVLVGAVQTSLYGQTNLPKFEIGAGISSFIYQGDLTPERFGSSRTIRFGINLFGSKLLSSSFALRTNLAIGGLKGDDGKYSEPEYRQQRNFNFRSRVVEVSELLVWSPLRSNYDDKGLSPYLFAGVGLSFLNVKRDWSNYNAEYFDAVSDVSARLAIDADHTPPRVTPVIPLGVGLRYALSSRMAVNVEGTYRVMNTDYLDGFSQSVNPELKDHYHTITVGAIYRIGKKDMMACPVLKY